MKEGFAADLAIMDYVPPTPMDASNFYGHMIFGISQSAVDTTIAAGRVLMEGKAETGHRRGGSRGQVAGTGQEALEKVLGALKIKKPAQRRGLFYFIAL